MGCTPKNGQIVKKVHQTNFKGCKNGIKKKVYKRIQVICSARIGIKEITKEMHRRNKTINRKKFLRIMRE
ncbi:hypothetical protein HYX00_03705 [Candidatus Woesearchaeota archaeon]|nr:hypothetical protein [Candidatus Woesearchaeota archaeon]